MTTKTFNILLTILLTLFSLQTLVAQSNNLARYKQTFASSQASDAFPAQSITDGIINSGNDATNRWLPTNNPDSPIHRQWIVIDLGAVMPIQHIFVYHYSVATRYNLFILNDAEDRDEAFFRSFDRFEEQPGFFRFGEYKTEHDMYAGVYLDVEVRNVVNQYFHSSPLMGRYVIYEQIRQFQTPRGWQSGSIREIEVYASFTAKADGAANTVTAPPTIPTGNSGTITLPDLAGTPLAGATLSIWGSDNHQIINPDGSFFRPLVDMQVNLLYQVDLGDGEINRATRDVTFIVPGRHRGHGVNPVPNVMPGIREWFGGVGNFVLSRDMTLGAVSAEERFAAERTQFFFAEMLNVNINIAPSGAIRFVHDANLLAELGSEGYYLTISENHIEIRAATRIALMYGGITVTQIFYSSPERRTVREFIAPVGYARDYPKYRVRAGMIDVGRSYMPLAYLEEIGRYMAWFKLNELHVHLNDYYFTSDYRAFRLENRTFPEVNTKIRNRYGIFGLSDGVWSQDEYREFQRRLRDDWGVQVINEIDVPAHSWIFGEITEGGPPMLPTNQTMMDLRPDYLQQTLDFVFKLFEEFIGGDDPVFLSPRIHFGSDEYDRNMLHYQAAFNSAMIEWLLDRGLQAQVWSSPGTISPANNIDLISNENVYINAWFGADASVPAIFELGYQNIINSKGGWFYLVPGCMTGYPDRWDRAYPDGRGPNNYILRFMYETFSMNNFRHTRSINVGTKMAAMADPRVVGGSFHMWGDFLSFGGGFSEFDIFDRLVLPILFTAEKTWYGEVTDRPGQTYENFRKRIALQSPRAPGANPARYIESVTDVLVRYDFTTATPLRDLSVNDYHATVTADNAIQRADGLFLPEGTALSLPFDAVGFPYTVSLRFKLPDIKDVPKNTIIFDGEVGTFYANYDGAGFFGFERGSYGIEFAFEFSSVYGDYAPKNQLVPGEWIDLVLVLYHRNFRANDPARGITYDGQRWYNPLPNRHQTDTKLYINGERVLRRPVNVTTRTIHPYRAFIPRGHTANRYQITHDSTSFVLPVERILPDVNAIVSRLVIYNRALSSEEIGRLYSE